MSYKDKDKKPAAPTGPWIKPSSRSEVEKAILKNLEGAARKGAHVESKGFLPTGHFNLDFAIRRGTLPINVDLSTLTDFDPSEPGGAPRGRIVEVYGEPGGGKTSLCLRIAGNAQKKKRSVLWSDREMSFVESLAIINGVDLDDMYMMDQPGMVAEECFDHYYKAMDSGIDLIVIDSVAGLIPRYVMEHDTSSETVALLARVMSRCMPKLADMSAKTGCTVIFINQIRQKPGVMFGDPTTTPGGEALKFFSSLRLQVTKAYGKEAEVYREDENGIDQLIAQKAYVYVRKNRFAKGMKEGIQIPIYFEPFFPAPEEVAFDIGRQTQVIKVRNGIFSWKIDEEKKVEGQGRKAFVEEIVAGKHLSNLIKNLKAETTEQNIVLPPELMTFKILDEKEIKKKEAVQSKQSAEIEAALEAEAILDAAAEANAKWDATKAWNAPGNVNAAAQAILEVESDTKTEKTDAPVLSRGRKKKDR